MIPPLGDQGYLPPGVHPATLDEVEARFGGDSELRRVQMESLRWLVELARRTGVQRLVINGSFVTDVFEPNDVDCVLLIGVGFPRDSRAEAELLAGLPFLELSLVNQADFDLLVDEFFATDRHSVGKGLVEIVVLTLQSYRELEATREKLRMLEERYESDRREQGGDEHVRELSRRSLKRLINQLQEEIARFESHSALGAGGK